MGILPMCCGIPQLWPVLRPIKQERSDRLMHNPNANLHRKNAAEWLMWIALWPVAFIMRVWMRSSGTKEGTVHEQG